MTKSSVGNGAHLKGPSIIDPSPAAGNLSETPRIPPLEKPPQEKKHATTIHKFRVKIAFSVPATAYVCPREKFGALLSLIIQQFPGTVLQPWEHEERGRVITAGEDLPFEKEQLSVFCPHERRNDRLSTQWNLQSDTRFYFIKSNAHILDHLHRFKVYLNPTNITAKSLAMIGWFQNSHPKFTCRDDAARELSQRLDTPEKLDLHVHHIKFTTSRQRHSTKALVLTCDREKTREMKSILYKMNNESSREKKRWAQTGPWFFVPFGEDGPVKTIHIAKMIACQNRFIRDAVNITVSGITNIKAHVTIPETLSTTAFDLWILSIMSSAGEPLFNSIERDSNDIYHFCTMKKHKEEAFDWIDELEESFCNLFSPAEINAVTTGARITRSYKVVPSDNAQDAANAFEQYLANRQVPINEYDEHVESSDDHLENCWKEPPRSVYSRTHNTASTASTSVSGLSTSGSDSAILRQTLQNIVPGTELSGKAHVNNNASVTILHETTAAIKKATLVQDNLTMLRDQTQAIERKTNELEKWKESFDEAQEQRFKESEKKMKKRFDKQEERIDNKFNDMSKAMEKNQASLLTALDNKNSEVQDQLNQMMQSVMVLTNSLEKQQGQIDTLYKRPVSDDDVFDGSKRARCDSPGHDHDDDMEDCQHIETQSKGTPHRDYPATTAKGRRVSRSAD